MAQENKEYQDFLEKFKPKKTTDDCYTPPETFEEITRWVSKTYGIDPATIVRPFWPGGDYKRANYPAGCVVLDNPPFSILSQIVGFYQTRGVRFFLFSPYLTCLNILSRHDVTCIVCDTEIVYENGARVNTSFVTNLDGRYMAMSAPSLARAIEAAEKRRLAESKKTLPKYKYPDEVLTATMLGYMAKHDVEYSVPRGSGTFIRTLESQKAAGKSIFGGGLLLTPKAAAEKAAAEKAAAEKAAAEKAAAEKAAAEKAAAEKAAAIPWKLSERERMLIRSMGGK